MQAIAYTVQSVTSKGARWCLSRFCSGSSVGWHSFWTLPAGKGRSLILTMADSSSGGSASTLSVSVDNRGRSADGGQGSRQVNYQGTSPQGRHQGQENRGRHQASGHWGGRDRQQYAGRSFSGHSHGRGPWPQGYEGRKGDGNYERGGERNWRGDGSGRQRAGPYPQSRGSDRNDNLVYLSKSLAWILRHAAESQGFEFLPGGFLYVDDILKVQRFRSFTVHDVQEVVEGNDKQRFALERDRQSNRLMIRANQGHSIEVEGLALTPITLENAENYPKVIHGTYLKNWESIKTQGLCRMNRNHIHFASGEPGSDGVISGMRKSCEVLIFLDLKKALTDGIEFFLSSNNVILSPGDKDGCIYPYYFEGVQKRSPRCKLEFDGSIKSKVVLGEKVADEQETKKRNSKKKKKNKERNVSDDGKEKAGKDNKMQGKLPGGKNGSESVVDQGGSGGKAAGGTASAGETGTVEGMEAGGMPEDDSNETDNPAWDIEEKNGETSMDADQSDSAEGMQLDVPPENEASVKGRQNDGGKPGWEKFMEVDSEQETGDAGETDADMEGDKSDRKKKQTGAAKDKQKPEMEEQTPTIEVIDSQGGSKEFVDLIENLDTKNGDSYLAVACFPDKSQQFSLICAMDGFRNINIFDILKCPDILSENQPLFDLIENNRNIVKILYNCVPTCKTLFEEYRICVVHVSLCDVQVMYEELAGKPENKLDPNGSDTLWSVAQQLGCSDSSVPEDEEEMDWTQRPLTDDMKTVVKTTLMTLVDVYQKLSEKNLDKSWKKKMYERVKDMINWKDEAGLYEERKKKKNDAKKKDPNDQVSKDATSGKKKGSRRK